MLKWTDGPLLEAHDLVMFDLDGVIYIGGEAIDGVAAAVDRVRQAQVQVAFVTNNASRTPDQVAAKLAELGVAADAADVVTSAQAAARLVRETYGDDVSVFVLGGRGLHDALAEQGLASTTVAEEAGVVVSGYGPDVLWKDIMRAATLVRDGTPYIASNSDLTIPTAYGPAPGHGVLVRTITEFADVEPRVAGKPSPPLLAETMRRVGGEMPLMVGDRLDTDILGAHAVSIDSLLVLTGVTALPELVVATSDERPSYISPTLAGLFEAQPNVRLDGGVASVGGWSSHVAAGRLTVEGDGRLADWWRAVAVAAWDHLDRSGETVDVAGLVPPGEHDAAEDE